MSRSVRTIWLLSCTLLVAGLLVGCEPDEGIPDLGAGQFTVRVDGAMSETLRGEAVYRTENRRLSGVELSVDSARGMSVQVEPQAQPRGMYEVVGWELMGVERGDAPPGTVAFLEVPGAQFHAVAGTLTVSYATSSEIAGSFVFRMEGRRTGVSNDDPEITVTGSFRADRQ